jgi:hypothetical protein
MTSYRYRIDVSYEGYDWAFDDKIVRTVGSRNWSGAGMGFGVRDVGFIFKTEQGYRNALARLRKRRLRYGGRAVKIDALTEAP